jgi:serine/threonine protein kinase
MFPDERDKNLLKLLLYLLTINPRARISAKQALMNPFFQEVSQLSENLRKARISTVPPPVNRGVDQLAIN